MKLYATTKSERASKGQGGNDFIEVLINNEQRDNQYRLYVTIGENDIMQAEVLNYKTGEKMVI